MSETETVCAQCGGACGQYIEIQVGEVTRDMALDACEPSRQGQPIMQEVWQECGACDGYGVTKTGGIDRCAAKP